MWPSLKTAALWTAIVASVGATAFLAASRFHLAPQFGQKIGGQETPPSDFTKTAYDENGNVLSGPLAVGQVIQYVLRYKQPPNGSSGPATINDTLSANQTYVAGSVNAPGWTLSTPVYNLNHEIYSSPGFGPSAFTLPIPAISGFAGAPGGGGDGYEPVPVVTSTGTKVFGVNHHQALNGRIMCWYGATLAKCSPAYPLRVSTSPEQRGTPDFPHAAVLNKKLYFPVGRYDQSQLTTLEFGIGCWDAETDSECPFISLPGQPSLNMAGNTAPYLATNLDAYVAGVRADPQNPSHLLMYALDRVYCVDIALPGAPACTGWTPPAIPHQTTNARSRDMFVEENGTRLYVSNVLPPHVYCIELSNGSFCPGWPAGGVDGGATMGTHLGPGIDSTGTMNAICLVQGFGPSNFRCFDLATGANVTSWPASLSTNNIFAAYHIPGTARVLFPPYTGFAGPKCYNFSTSAACAPYTPYWNNLNNWTDGGGNPQGPVRDYGYASDPSAPQDCIYGLGDGGNLVRFGQDGKAATTACVPKAYYATFDLGEQFCFHKPDVATWTSLDILNRPATLIGGTITLKDSSGTVIQTIAVNSNNNYALNLSALGLNGTVTVDFTPQYTGNTPPSTDYQLRLNYSADEDSQICYQATVSGCGEVSNTATLADQLETLTASVDLGRSYGGECGPGPVPNCLDLVPSIAASPDGTGVLTLNVNGPPGFTSTLVTVASLTNGVNVAPPSRIFGMGQTQGNWALTGLVPGMVVKFKVDAVDTGGGSKPGTDKCCSSTIEVTVPDKKAIPPKTDLAIEKTGATTVEEHKGMPSTTGYEFTLKVANIGDPLAGAHVIVVADTVPVGMVFTNAFGTDWDCGPAGQFPIPGGGVLSCTYLGTAQIATGASLPPITVKAQVLGDPSSYTFQNCASVGLAPDSGLTDGNSGNDRSCYSGERERPRVTPPPAPKCDKRSTLLEDDACICRYANMTRKTPTQCACPSGQSLVAGKGCVKEKLVCDKWSARPQGDSCSCLYDRMSKTSDTSCSCPAGEITIAGVGCVAPKNPDEPHKATPVTPNTSVEPPAACAEGTTMDASICVPVCEAPLTLNAERTACECPKGTELKDGKCVKESNLLDDVLGNVHFGVGIGGGGGSSSKQGPSPAP
ncbi:MAG: hypothetical protein P4L72_11795 [Parvibaculum sp.]|uniref:hypothetical protein n=1 Tax=Parvibaculum sp. TaxID=2024848 RepID=UPI00284AFA20|nr:hypothetical protein [Parvibaculum sp.]MDR3499895.1 hypothetical protein [Parvibaculum sp.]